MGEVIYIRESELTSLLVQLIKQYKFRHNNEYPEKIVLPVIKEVEGVIIEQATEPVVLATQPEKRKKKGVKDAVTS